jgi:hypothetical protein
MNRIYAATAILATATAAIWISPIRVLAKTNSPSGTIVFRDAATDELKSDGLGPYVNGAAGASVFFQTGGDIKLDLSASTRTVNLDFSSPDTALNQSRGYNPFPALYSGAKHATITQGILNADGTCCTSTGLLGLAPGQVAQSFLAIAFTSSTGTSCNLVFGKPAPGYENTNDATVVHNADGTFTFTTFATDVAKLTCAGRGNTVIVEGYFYMPTQFTVTKN